MLLGLKVKMESLDRRDHLDLEVLLALRDLKAMLEHQVSQETQENRVLEASRESQESLAKMAKMETLVPQVTQDRGEILENKENLGNL